MPLYEYECLKCQRIIEMMQKFSDPPLSVCPDCGAPVTKLMSLSSFALKGSGWYTTDYKRARGRAEGGSGKGEDASHDALQAKNSAPNARQAESPKSEPAKAEAPKPEPSKASKKES